MKRILILLLLSIYAKITLAQKELSFDEHNKYIYYQVVDMPGLTKDTLLSRGLLFLKSTYPKTKVAATANQITDKGKFLVYGGASILKHENGEITYLLTIECKDQKYRYWITDFVFTPYQRDRYGNFVPEQGINIPLESASSKLDKKEADLYVQEAGMFCKEVGAQLKLYITEARASKKPEITKKVVTDNW
jgi:hypothetical protein